MPRGRRSQPSEDTEDFQNNAYPPVFIHQEPPTQFAGPFLKKNYWEMSQKLGIEHQCSICLTKIDCPKCFTILCNCGHVFDFVCITAALRVNNACPLCRQNLGNE